MTIALYIGVCGILACIAFVITVKVMDWREFRRTKRNIDKFMRAMEAERNAVVIDIREQLRRKLEDNEN